MVSQIIGTDGCNVDDIVKILLENVTSANLLDNIYTLMTYLGTKPSLRDEIMKGLIVYKTMELAQALTKILTDYRSRSARNATIVSLVEVLKKCDLNDIAFDLDARYMQNTNLSGGNGDTETIKSIPLLNTQYSNRPVTESNNVPDDNGKCTENICEHDSLLNTYESTDNSNKAQSTSEECIDSKDKCTVRGCIGKLYRYPWEIMLVVLFCILILVLVLLGIKLSDNPMSA